MASVVSEQYKKLRSAVREFFVCKDMRQRLKSKDFSLFSSDCVGGTVLHDLGLRFNSPTVNMFMMAPDYIKFLRNLTHYIATPLQEIDRGEYNYPLAKCDDITIHLVHYESVMAANQKWLERSERVNRSNMFFIMNDRNGCSIDEFKAFAALPYKNKVFITVHQDWTDERVKTFLISAGEGAECPIVTAYKGLFSIHRNYDLVDWVKWLNDYKA